MTALNLASVSSATLVNPTVMTCFPSLTDNTKRLILSPPTTIKSAMFRLRAVVVYTFGAAAITFEMRVQVWAGTSSDLTTQTSNETLLDKTTAASGGATTQSGFFAGDFAFDPESAHPAGNTGLICGYMRVCMGGTLIATGSTTSTPAFPSQFSGAGAQNLQFTCACMFGTSNAGNRATLTEFAIDQD